MPVSFLEPGSTVYIAVFQVLESEFLFRHFPGVRIENVEQGGVKTFGVESLYVLPYPFFHHISPIVLHPYDNGVEGAFLFRSIMFDICSGTQRERFNQDSVRLLVDRTRGPCLLCLPDCRNSMCNRSIRIGLPHY